MKNKKYLYFTFNDPLSGVYQSQVIDVIKAIRKLNENIDIRLLLISSPRFFLSVRKKIKKTEPNSIVLPTLAPLRYWWVNKLWLILLKPFINSSIIYCRGPLATCMAIDTKFKSKIIYDGRGAVYAEHIEYGIYSGTRLESKIKELERKAVMQSDGRIAVSQKLIEYWRQTFGYEGNLHQVIPCTVSVKESSYNLPDDLKDFLETNKEKVIFAFAGGNGKWQGIHLIIKFLESQFQIINNSCALLLTPKSKQIDDLINKYPERVFVSIVAPSQVQTALKKCDYGLLLRESCITNKVASPVKVAEYLMAGLMILISPEIGDYSEQIVKNNLGFIIKNEHNNLTRLKKVTDESKNRLSSFARNNYSKASYRVMNRYLLYNLGDKS